MAQDNFGVVGKNLILISNMLLNNKKITGFVYERNMNFIKQCLAMVIYRTGTIKRPDIKRFEKKTIMNRLWLMKKIKELK